MALRVGVLTASDRASSGVYADLSGREIEAALREWIDGELTVISRLCPDEQPALEASLRSLCDDEGCDLVLTTGGTGPAPRDVTPEATAAVCSRLLPGFGERMRAVSVQTVPTAILSRQLAGIRDKTLLINLPGKPRAIRECLGAVFAALPGCLRLIGAQSFTPSTRAPVTAAVDC